MSERTAPDFIHVNGQIEALAAATVSALLAAKEIAGAPRGIAVAINGAVVPRAAWPDTRLTAGDRIEIVRVRQGG
jgi:sulfur carrier protein